MESGVRLPRPRTRSRTLLERRPRSWPAANSIPRLPPRSAKAAPVRATGSALAPYCRKHCLDSARVEGERFEAGIIGGGDAVDLHELDLISSHRRIRDLLGEKCQHAPELKRHWREDGLEAEMLADCSKEIFVRV